MPGFLDRLLGRERDPSDEVADDSGETPVPGIYTSEARGVLPGAQGGTVGDVALPPGVLVAREDEDEPVIWISATPVEGVTRLWGRLAAAFPTSGLWPLVMKLEVEPVEMSEIFARPTSAGTRTARRVLAEWSSELGNKSLKLAAPTAGPHPDGVDHLVGDLSGHLGLVPVSRPADVLAATGWTGASNYDLDPGDLSTVLRSWEERFDAYAVGLGWDTVHVAVGRPPRDRATAVAIAEEHYAFCLDNIEQGIGDVGEYGKGLVGATVWPFWWD